jgi:DNA-binding CsgD family transcriptional regulator
MPLGADTVSNLLGSLYDGASDPHIWDFFLQQLAQSTGATSAGLVLRDAGRDVHTISHSWGLDAEFRRLYQERYHSLDIWGERGLSRPPGYVCGSEELCPLAELAATEFYNDFLVPQNVEHGLFVVVDNTGPLFASVSLYRDAFCPAFDDAELGILRILAPHAQRAFRLHLHFSELKARSVGLEMAFDMLPTGVIFLGTKGEVLLMNRSALASVSERDGLLATRDGLRAERVTESAVLERTIREAAATLSGKGLSAGGTVMVSRRSRRPLQVRISPVRKSLIHTSQAIAAVAFVIDPLRQHRPTQEVLRVLYGLTPAECRVALLLGDGHAPRKVAGMVGVTQNTVRSQIKSIFSKTGVRRQGELIRLLLTTSQSGD